MDTYREPLTDPRANEPIPAIYVPTVIGDSRLVAAEVRIAAEMIARESDGDIAHEARKLAAQATRFGQVVNLFSALPGAQKCALYLPPDAAKMGRLKLAWWAFWQVWRANK